MFEILIYLFENYIRHELEISIDYKVLINDLSNIGFQLKDIYSTLRWLKNVSSYKKNLFFSNNSVSHCSAIRVYTKEESIKINSDCRGFMLFLEHLEILTLDMREIVIERIMALDISELSLKDLKLIILVIFFNIPGGKVFYKKFKNLLFFFKTKMLH